MQSSKEIKAKIKSVANLKKITRAMEMVARSKMKRATDQAQATRVFARRALEILATVSDEIQEKSIFLEENPAGEKTLLLVIAANKGLCGGYNMGIYRELVNFGKEVDLASCDVVAVGKYSARNSKKVGAQVVESFLDLPEWFTSVDIAPIVTKLVELFQTGKYATVRVVYTNFVSAFSQVPATLQLLPLKKDVIIGFLQTIGEDSKNTSTEESEEATNTQGADYVFEPSEEEMVATVVPQLAQVVVLQAHLEAAASEHSARMVAMKSATENADELGKQLNLDFNRARQAAVTQEILEITGGAAAVS